MCGIIGYNGKEKNGIKVLIEGLKTLEYRGYDSSGVAYIENKEIKVVKSIGKIKNLENKIDMNIKTNIGIGHTRWATHGNVNEENSHPHTSGEITIVHNGIIENYNEIKKELIKENYKFKSTTDTEVAAALIDYYYKRSKDIKRSIIEFEKKVKGSYAIEILVKNDKSIYVVRKDSPLIIGKGEKGNYIASDIIAVSKYTNKVMYLKEKVIAKVEEDKITLYDSNLKEVKEEYVQINTKENEVEKNGYEHYMQKEIYEQPRVFKDTVEEYVKEGIKSVIGKMPDFSKYNRIDIVACGSAYNAGLVGKVLIEENAKIKVNVEIASEYRYKDNFYDKKTLIIIISQSGETADTIACLRKAKKDKIDTLAIINVENSTIYREADKVLLVKGGREIAVATTKVYLGQITMLSLIALNIAYSKKMIEEKEIKKYFEEIRKMPEYIEDIIRNDKYKEIAEEINKRNNVFYIGRAIDYALCMEGSLKLKEITYIASQAYAAGELKHGTISLINDKTPVISIITDEKIELKTISNIEEVRSRGATIICITNDEKINNYDYNIKIKKVHKLLQPVLAVIPLQLIAYETAKVRGCDIDKPKNLAKSVTVE